MASEPERFLSLLWPDGLPPGYWLNLFVLPDKSSYYHRDAVKAANDMRVAGGDVYYGVGLATEPKSAKSRFSQADISCLPGVFADIDAKNGVTEGDIYDWLKELIPTTMTVYTGGGIHAYWCFDKPLIGRERIAGVLAGWRWYLRNRCPFKFDDTAIEPSRVLRLPGYTNSKYKPERNVQIVTVDGARYGWDEIPQDEPPYVSTIQTLNGYVGEGARNTTLAQFMGWLRGVGLNADQMVAFALLWDRIVSSPSEGERIATKTALSIARKPANRRGERVLRLPTLPTPEGGQRCSQSIKRQL